MTGNKIKTIILAVALVLIIALGAGLIMQLTKQDKTDNPVLDDTQQYELSGKVYDAGGNEMLAERVYAMPTAMTFSALQDDYISRVTVTATVTPDNATDGSVEWSILFNDGYDTDGYLSLEPTYYGSNTAVLTCYQPFDYTAIITATACSDSTKKAECYVDYLYEFNPVDLNINWSSTIVFGQDDYINLSQDFYGTGTVEGDLEFGELYLELNPAVVNAISYRLGREFTPNNLILNNGFSSDGISFNCPSPYACFAANSGIDEKTFNEAFTRAIYFGCGEDCDYHARFYFTAKYSYKGDVVKTVQIAYDGYERITVDFSLIGLFVPVEDVTINGGNIVLGVGTSEAITCSFDSIDSTAISTDSRITVIGNQSSCSATTVNALGSTYTKYLKMESATQVLFTTAVDMTLKIYVDTEGKRIKIDGTNYTSVATADGDNVITVTLSAGSHTITKGDAMGVFALTLNKA